MAVVDLAATSGCSVHTSGKLYLRFSLICANVRLAVATRLLDARVVFVNEDGPVFGKADLIAPRPGEPHGVSNALVQTGFAVARHGDVAVTEFIDNATTHVHGQIIRAKFRSTESMAARARGLADDLKSDDRLAGRSVLRKIVARRTCAVCRNVSCRTRLHRESRPVRQRARHVDERRPGRRAQGGDQRRSFHTRASARTAVV